MAKTVLNRSVSAMAQAVQGKISVCSKLFHFFPPLPSLKFFFSNPFVF